MNIMDTNPSAFPLLQLPPELRNKIYTAHFRSVRLVNGEQHCNSRIVAEPLALLRTCRQIHTETSLLWLNHVHLSYESPEILDDKLAGLDMTLIKQIRHVSIGRQYMSLRPIGGQWEINFLTPAISKALAHMNLDTLTIYANAKGQNAYNALETLIRHGIGWRELRFVTRDSRILLHAQDRLRFPATDGQTWSEMLAERDGERAGGAVRIYRAKWVGPVRQVFDPATRTTYEQDVVTTSPIAVPDTPRLMEAFDWSQVRILSGKERMKATMIVVRRGRKVDVGD